MGLDRSRSTFIRQVPEAQDPVPPARHPPPPSMAWPSANSQYQIAPEAVETAIWLWSGENTASVAASVNSKLSIFPTDRAVGAPISSQSDTASIGTTQNSLTPASDQVSKTRPSGENASTVPAFGRVATSSTRRASQILIVPFRAVASSRPSGEKASARTIAPL